MPRLTPLRALPTGAALALLATAIGASAAAAQPGGFVPDDGHSYLQSTGKRYVTKAIDAGGWFPSASLSGLAVTAFWYGGTSETAVWGELADGTWGIEHPFLSAGYFEELSGFRLRNARPQALQRLVFAGTTGGIVFDRTFAGQDGTPGSGAGGDLTLDGWTGAWPGHVTAHYRNAVRRVGQTAVGDLFETLDVTFAAGVTHADTAWLKVNVDRATTQRDRSQFRRRDRRAAVGAAHAEGWLAAPTAPVTTVPEPAGWALLAGGLVALGAGTRRRSRGGATCARGARPAQNPQNPM